MARTKTAELLSEEPAPPKIRKCCGTCKGWRPKSALPAFGDCMPSMRASSAPIITPDLACCSIWELNE